MFCPKCGAKLMDNANFCHLCGTKVEGLTKKKSDTRDFPPVSEEQNLDGPKSIEKTMETTSDLVEIIAEVDKKINEEITKHENSDTEKDPNFIGPKITDKGTVKPRQNTMPFAPVKESSPKKEETKVISKKDLKDAEKKGKKENKQKPVKKRGKTPRTLGTPEKGKEKEENLLEKAGSSDNSERLSKKEETPESKEGPKKKRGLKELWRDFIEEDDDEYSIFSALKKVKEEKPKSEETSISGNIPSKEKTASSSEEEPLLEEDFLLPPMDDEFATGSEIIHTLLEDELYMESLEKEQSQGEKEEEKHTEHTSGKSETTLFTPPNFKKRGSWKKEKKGPVPMAPLTEEELKTPVKKEKKDFSSKLTPTTPKKKEKTSSEPPLDVPKEESAKEDAFKGISTQFKLFEKIRTSIQEENMKDGVLPLVVALLFTAFGPAFVLKSFSGTLILLILGKLLLQWTTYRVSLGVASDQTGLCLTGKQKNLSAVTNFGLCSIIAFLSFLVNGTFGEFSLISATTSPIWATGILLVLSTILALIFHSYPMDKREKINFSGWYAITFIALEMVWKLIWFFISLLATIF